VDVGDGSRGHRRIEIRGRDALFDERDVERPYAVIGFHKDLVLVVEPGELGDDEILWRWRDGLDHASIDIDRTSHGHHRRPSRFARKSACDDPSGSPLDAQAKVVVCEIDSLGDGKRG
jgi:hypothetical protein